MALPIIFGVTTMSVITCTTMNRPTAMPKIIQKFCPVSAALSIARNAAGIRAKVCRYGIKSRMPINMPRLMAMGKSMMVKPMQNITAMQNATVPCPRI